MAFSSKPSHLSILLLLLLFCVVLPHLAQLTLAGRPPPITNPNKSNLQAAQSTPSTRQTEGVNSGKKQQAETNPGGEKEQTGADADKKQTDCFGGQEGTAPLIPGYGVPTYGGTFYGGGGVPSGIGGGVPTGMVGHYLPGYGGTVPSGIGGGVPTGMVGQYLPGYGGTFVPYHGFEMPKPANGAP